MSQIPYNARSTDRPDITIEYHETPAIKGPGVVFPNDDDHVCIKINGSYYVPIWHPDGTNTKNPIAWVRQDYRHSAFDALDTKAKEHRL